MVPPQQESPSRGSFQPWSVRASDCEGNTLLKYLTHANSSLIGGSTHRFPAWGLPVGGGSREDRANRLAAVFRINFGMKMVNTIDRATARTSVVEVLSFPFISLKND